MSEIENENDNDNDNANDMDENEYQLSIYANDKENFLQIENIKANKHRNTVTSLKICHSNLTILKGLPEFTSLLRLDLSFNKIQSINLYMKGLGLLKYLNLMCNLLSNVNGIEHLYSLEEVNLSHNKITGIEAFALLSDTSPGKLRVIDMRDNLIGSLNQLVYLQGFTELECLLFKVDDDANPICGYDNYLEFIHNNFSTIKILDNEDVNMVSAPQKQKSTYPYTLPSPKSSHSFQEIKYRNFNKANTINTNFANINLYREEIKNLQNNINELFIDQKDLVFKYEKNENYWKSKVDDLMETIKSLKNENNSLVSTLDEKDFSFNELKNKIGIRDHEIAAFKKANDEKENDITDLTMKLASIKKDYEFSLIDKEKLLKTITDLGKEFTDIKAVNKSLRDSISNEENFYKALLGKKSDELNERIRFISTLENKIYDFTKSLSDKQKEIESLVESNNSLQSTIVKYSKLKNDIEFELSQKFENERQTLSSKYKSQVEEIEKNYKKILSQKDEEFINDIKTIERNYENLLESSNGKILHIGKENEKLKSNIEDCKALLQTSLTNEEKNETLMKNLEKINFEITNEKENMKIAYDKENANNLNKIKFLEMELKDLNAEYSKLDSNVSRLKSEIKEKENDTERISSDMNKLKKELAIRDTAIEKLEKEMSKYIEEISSLKSKLSSDSNLAKIAELNDIIKTKNLMLDDQTNQIIELKHIIAGKDNEIEDSKGKCEKIKQKYDKKIQAMKNDINELNAFIEANKATLEEYENESTNLKIEYEKQLNENILLQNKISERDEVIKLIQNEINEIREITNSNAQLLQDKTKEIKECQGIIEELNKNLVSKHNENKGILESFENFRTEKALEIEILKKKISEVEDDMIIVLKEYENQKNLIKANIQNFSQMFGV